VGNLSAYIALCERAVQCNEQAGDSYKACGSRINLGYAECRLGAHTEAASLLRAAIVQAERMGLDYALGMAWQNLGLALGNVGALDDARAMEEKAISFFAAQGNPRLEGVSCAYLAQILLSAGELEEAEAQARRAVQMLEGAIGIRVLAQATLAQVLLAHGRVDEALAEARATMTLLTSSHKVDEGEVLTRAVYAEALFATGDRGAARLIIADARNRLLAAAARIEDPGWRDSFLHNVPENARTLELARQWLDSNA
jgi:eukaryotic-like serine/threonine-protein kinase